ncbi:hypothetical protein [Amygdalobacter nucleatus]|uniref:hypothetical protein n=1 Tax=Amygdalobacter nucleatus TaxID=3029274 RepID=UPI0027AB10A3|nr:hypothetical protein [Amygdalobacter nucleatus]WEG36954.1 hypothetical protein PYS63_00470 [Amygdalobacter nucleatus]
MKKIVTLALAAVMTLGLTVLPKAEGNNAPADPWGNVLKKNEEKEKTVDELASDYYIAKGKLAEAKKALDEANKKYNEDKSDTNKTDRDNAYKAWLEAGNAYEVAQAAYEAKLTGKKDEKKDTTVVDEYKPGYGYVYMKVADGKDVSGFVKAGAYTVNSLIKHFGLEHVVLADDQAPLVEVKELKVTTIKVAVVQQYPIKVRAISEDGTELGEYEVNAGLYATRGWVTAEKVAAKALTFKNGVALVDDVDGYWVLADVEANKTPQYFHKTTEGGNRVITAVYTVAKHKVWQGKDGKTTTKPGQVGKTGEVATVATGIGALMTLAGVVLATKRH